MPTLNAQKVYENTVAKIYAPTKTQYTPTQVVNSLVRAHAHAVKFGSAVEAAIYGKAVKIAKEALAKAHAEGFVPCGDDCMKAAPDAPCVCHCGGKNHGIKITTPALGIDTNSVEEIKVPVQKKGTKSAAAQALAAIGA